MPSVVALGRGAERGHDSLLFTPLPLKTGPPHILAGVRWMRGECSQQGQNIGEVASKFQIKSHGHSATHTEMPHDSLHHKSLFPLRTF